MLLEIADAARECGSEAHIDLIVRLIVSRTKDWGYEGQQKASIATASFKAWVDAKNVKK